MIVERDANRYSCERRNICAGRSKRQQAFTMDECRKPNEGKDLCAAIAKCFGD